MSFQVTTAFVQQFKANVMLLTQQMESRLRMHCMEEPVTGDRVYFEQIAPTIAQLKTVRHGPTPFANTPHARRVAFMSDYNWGDLIDNTDKLKMLIDPTSTYAINAAAALNRSLDNLIITNIFGTAMTGAAGTTPVTFPASQQVAANYVESGSPATSGLTVGKLRRAKAILDANEVPEGEGRTIVVRAQQVQDLLGTTETNSILTNQIRALVDGTLDFFMGFKFVRTELLPVATPGSGGVTSVGVFSKMGVGVAVGEDIITRISERADLNYSTQVYCEQSFGATRVDEKRVVQILCADTTSTNIATN